MREGVVGGQAATLSEVREGVVGGRAEARVLK